MSCDQPKPSRIGPHPEVRFIATGVGFKVREIQAEREGDTERAAYWRRKDRQLQKAYMREMKYHERRIEEVQRCLAGS